MLTPEYLAGIADPLQAIYAQLQEDIEADIARRIRKAGGKLTETAMWQTVKLQQVGASYRMIMRHIASKTGVTESELRRAYTAAGYKSSAVDEVLRRALVDEGKLPDTGIPLTATDAAKQVLRASLDRTKGTLEHLTRTMAADASGQLNKYLDRAQLMVQSGAFTQEQAIDRCVQDFADEGVKTFDYASGIRTSIEAAVRRALVTGINQATAEISMANAQTLGTDLVEVTSHADARPDHAKWQGKVYSISGKTPKYRKLSAATGYGTGAGLCGWNCRHSFYAFVEGISEKLPKEKYDPKTYQAEQIQRFNERQIRKWKRKANTLRAGGVDPSAAQDKVKEWQEIQREHVSKHDLARMYDREKVYTAKAPTAPGAEPLHRPTVSKPKTRGTREAEAKAVKEREARAEAARKAREEEARKEAEREEAARKAREEAERKAREEAERRAREEAARKAREEAERKAREEAERKAAEEAERKRIEDERRAAEEAAKKTHKPTKRTSEKPEVLPTAQRPKTIQKLERQQEKHLKDQASNSLYTGKEANAANKRLQSIVKTAKLRMRVPTQDIMEKILDSGKFMNQMETGTSKGTFNPSIRKQATERLFGVDSDDLENKDYEKYGYLWDDDFVTDFKDDVPYNYGRVSVQLKDSVRSRTTFCMEDSLAPAYHESIVPSLVDSVKKPWASYGGTAEYAVEALNNPKVKSIRHICRETSTYVEAQYHGDLTIEDIESVVLNESEVRRNGENMRLIKRLQEKGIKVGKMTVDRLGQSVVKWY